VQDADPTLEGQQYIEDSEKGLDTQTAMADAKIE